MQIKALSKSQLIEQRKRQQKELDKQLDRNYRGTIKVGYRGSYSNVPLKNGTTIMVYKLGERFYWCTGKDDKQLIRITPALIEKLEKQLASSVPTLPPSQETDLDNPTNTMLDDVMSVQS